MDRSIVQAAEAFESSVQLVVVVAVAVAAALVDTDPPCLVFLGLATLGVALGMHAAVAIARRCSVSHGLGNVVHVHIQLQMADEDRQVRSADGSDSVVVREDFQNVTQHCYCSLVERHSALKRTLALGRRGMGEAGSVEVIMAGYSLLDREAGAGRLEQRM